jgi:ergothioneine biosynthesis protein EgtB
MIASTPRLYSAAEALRTGGKSEARSALLHARERTLRLADACEHALGPALRVPVRPTLNPPLWELGHVAWFQEYWIARNPGRMLGNRCDTVERAPSLLAGADALYDSSHVPHDTRWGLPLPDAAATRDYLARSLEQTLQLLDGSEETPGDDALYFFRLCALHEEMHAEAAAYMARALGFAVPAEVLRELSPRKASASAPPSVKIPSQLVLIGSPERGFAFDNELAAHEVRLDAFEIDARPVTWARFAEFVAAGGYREPRWWDEAGARWLASANALSREASVDLESKDADAPAVHLGAHEARAWCRWAGRRLPTEFEWECAATTERRFTWGDVWEWTASAFTPYPGFRPHPYKDYSAPWFADRVVLRGACLATSASLMHPRYRNFFPADRDDIFSGFRSCAR